MQHGEDYKPRATSKKLEDSLDKLRLSDKVRGGGKRRRGRWDSQDRWDRHRQAFLTLRQCFVLELRF